MKPQVIIFDETWGSSSSVGVYVYRHSGCRLVQQAAGMEKTSELEDKIHDI